MANLSSTRIFGDGTVERSLYVKQRLGVGVGNPNQRLHVEASWKNQIQFGQGGTSNYASLSSGTGWSGWFTGGSSQTTMIRAEHDGSQVVFPNGNVGIGTTSPSNDLDINTSGTDSGISFGGSTAITGTTGNGWLRLNQNNNFSNGIYTPGPIRADGNGSSRAAEFQGDVDMKNNQLDNVNQVNFNSGAYIDEGTADYGSIRVGGGADGGWLGINIQANDDWVLMAEDGAEDAGFYNDDRNEWIWRSQGQDFRAYYNGNQKLRTTGSGIDMNNNDINNVDNINVNETIGLPSGTSAERPNNPVLGMMRYNTEIEVIEVYNGEEWVVISDVSGIDPAPSLDNFTFGVQAGNSTSSTKTAVNSGTGTNSDLTLSNVSLNAGASSELSVSNTGRDVTVTADASSASGGETYTGTVTVTDDGASSALENEDTDTADVTVNVSGLYLYEFTSATFTTGGSTGRTGPSLSQAQNGLSADGNDSWKNDTAFFDTSNGIQLWTVPETATYTIKTQGASAGNQNETNVAVGSPARMIGDFDLQEGEQIKILVGQHGFLGDDRPGWGGGGGTFVTKSDDTPLIIAGGCGASHTDKSGFGYQSARIGEASFIGSDNPNSTYGSLGQGGPDKSGGSGGGLLSNGQGGQPEDGFGFVNGGEGSPDNRGGGFGGGGGCTNTWGGGGGGYTGGGGGGDDPYTGGGGGSFNSGTNQNNSIPFSTTSQTIRDGYVIITKK